MKPLAHWSMNGHTRDEFGVHHGNAQGIRYTTLQKEDRSAAVFNGTDSCMKVPHHDLLHLGKDDFTLALWMHTQKDTACYGDLVNKFDEKRRNGFTLSVIGSSGGYTGVSDTRHLFFGIDDAVQTGWTDHGKPCTTNTLIPTLCVYEEALYAGIADAGDDERACRIYRLEGQNKWIDCGRLGQDRMHRTVHSMLVHQGALYAATGISDWDKAFAGQCAPGRVFRYRGGQDWQDMGQVGVGYRVMAMASFEGQLYAATDASEVFRYQAPHRWVFCGADRRPYSKDPSDIFRLDTLFVWKNRLYGGGRQRIFRYEGGTDWTCITHRPYDTTQIHKLSMHQGDLMVGTWPHGHVLRFLSDEDAPIDNGTLGIDPKYEINEVNDMAVYNGKLYAGVIPTASVYRFEKTDQWHCMANWLDNPNFENTDVNTWYRVPSMAVYRGRLFASVSECHGRASSHASYNAGRLFSIGCGVCVTLDHDIGHGRHHIAVQKSQDRLSIFVDGKKRSQTFSSMVANLDLNNEQPIQIGHGPLGPIHAAIDDVRLIRGLVEPEKLMEGT